MDAPIADIIAVRRVGRKVGSALLKETVEYGERPDFRVEGLRASFAIYGLS